MTRKLFHIYRKICLRVCAIEREQERLYASVIYRTVVCEKEWGKVIEIEVVSCDYLPIYYLCVSEKESWVMYVCC